MHVLRTGLVLLLAAALSGCTLLAFYWQAVGGELDILGKREPIHSVISDPDTPAQTRAQLTRVLAMRDFASTDLGLPDDGTFRSYVQLDRPYPVWNVFAAPRFSVQPKTWCFLFSGCVPYRGYFHEDAAREFAAKLRSQGDDVVVGGVPAYSTLGWFDDPVLSSILDWPEGDQAELIFHELAHEKFYIEDDSAFNESFAQAVAQTGAQRWFAAHHETARMDALLQRQDHDRQVNALLLQTRERLDTLYKEQIPDTQKQQRKTAAFLQLRADYAALKARWPQPDPRWDEWFAGELNNASLLTAATYEDLAPGFRALLQQCDGELQCFYAQTARIAGLDKDHRRAALRALDAAPAQSRKRR